MPEMPVGALILNVDDDDTGRYVKSRALRLGGHTVVEAANGTEALRLVAAEPPALVLLDVRLPDMDGFEVCRLIKRDHPEVLVLQVSASFLTGGDRVRGLEGGADAYLTLPIEPQELLASVGALLRLRAAEDGLRRLNATLEQRIADRTRDLEQALANLAEEAAERRRAEEALAQAQKMEALGRLTGGVAHDFNNLLQAVTSGATLIQRRANNPAQVRELAETVRQAASRGAALTARLLAFARRQDLQPQDVDAGQLVRGMAGLLASTLGPSIRIDCAAFPQELGRPRTDPNQLELALLNLAVNARDAMPDGGTLRFSGRDVRLTADADGAPLLAPGDYVVLAVADTGTGMDAATLARATEPFFTTKGIGKGTGLGLSMVHGLAAQSGGTLRLLSTPGEGTTAELWLPRAPGQQPANALPETPQPARTACSSPLTVLVVDDDALVLRSAVALLTDLGHFVLEAGRGDAALAILQSGAAVDLLLADQMMPGLSGLETVLAARALRPGLPAILATGFAEVELRDVPHDLPLLRKPYGEPELVAAINRAGPRRRD